MEEQKEEEGDKADNSLIMFIILGVIGVLGLSVLFCWCQRLLCFEGYEVKDELIIEQYGGSDVYEEEVVSKD